MTDDNKPKRFSGMVSTNDFNSSIKYSIFPLLLILVIVSIKSSKGNIFI